MEKNADTDAKKIINPEEPMLQRSIPIPAVGSHPQPDLRRRESPLADANLRSRPRVQEHFNNVKTEKQFGVTEGAQPRIRPADDEPALGAINRPGGFAKLPPAPRFHFAKDEDLSVAVDDIDFPPALRFEIAVEDFFSAAPELFAGEAFSGAPDMGIPLSRSHRIAIREDGDAVELPVDVAKVGLVELSHVKLSSNWETGAKLRR